MQIDHSIKAWEIEDRPREKLQKWGARTLSNAELCAIVIRSGTLEDNAVELARKILHRYQNDIYAISNLTVDELCSFKGIGPAKAVALIAAFQLGKRAIQGQRKEQVRITSSMDAYHLIHPLLSDLKYEEFWVVFLNRGNKVMEVCQISSGGIAGTVVDNKIIFKQALDKLASSLILAHNHPSGTLEPSNQDIAITKKLKSGAELFDLKILDHLIVTRDAYYSFMDEGIL